MNKFIVPLIVLIVVAAGAFIVLGNEDESESVDTSPATSQTIEEATDETDEQPEEISQTISASEVAMHAVENDCWTIIGTNVYDITAYVPRHPGGDEILLACGTDGTSLFQDRTTADGEEVGSGTPHSSNAANQLEDLLIGAFSE